MVSSKNLYSCKKAKRAGGSIQVLTATEVLQVLTKKYGLDYANPLWWDFLYPDSRALMKFSRFYSSLRKHPTGVYVFNKKIIPITYTTINLDGLPVSLFFTARPALSSEFSPAEKHKHKFAQSSELSRLFGDDELRLDDDFAQEEEQEKQKRQPLPKNVRPHPRGIAIGIDEQRIYYYTLPPDKEKNSWHVQPKLEEAILAGLEEQNSKKIDTCIASHLTPDDATKKITKTLLQKNLIMPKKRTLYDELHRDFSTKLFEQRGLGIYRQECYTFKDAAHVPFFDISFDRMPEKRMISYVPVTFEKTIEDEHLHKKEGIQSVPIVISTIDPQFGFVGGFYVLGLYASANAKHARVIPFSDMQYALKISESFAKSFHVPTSLVNTVFVTHQPGKKSLHIVPHELNEYKEQESPFQTPQQFLQRYNNYIKYVKQQLDL